MAGFLFRAAVALVMLAAGVAMATSFDRMGHRLDLLGVPVWLRVVGGLVQVAGAALLLLPGRTGYGAALVLVASGAALVAHAAVLGWDSAPPAIALAAASALLLWRNRADLKR